LRVDLDQLSDTHATIRFRISDTGIGIPSDRMHHIFESFSQADSSTSRKFGGTGLGLNISKRLAEMMGGGLGVESQEGIGTTFWFTIVFEKQVNAAVKGPIVPTNICGKKILIVDDNETNRIMLMKQLKVWGFRYDEAFGGEDALVKMATASCTNDPYEIAIIDYQMPNMNGKTLGERIKTHSLLQSSALVLMTPFGHSGSVEASSKNGFDAYLTKPVKPSSLYDCLAMISGQRQTGGPKVKNDVNTNCAKSDRALHKDRILLVEDNSINQKVALNLLKELGYTADVACDGKEAIRAMTRYPYALVLMDCQMPQMDGYEATACIRDPQNNALNPNTPIIAMTANAMKGDKEECIDAGMNDYLSKPVNALELDALIQKWLRMKVA